MRTRSKWLQLPGRGTWEFDMQECREVNTEVRKYGGRELWSVGIQAFVA